MFTKISHTDERPIGGAPARRGRGRPRGTTAQGEATRAQLYRVAIRLIVSRGYEGTTLRDIAKKARVSPGLLYRYFPSKRAVVLALYDELSAEYATRAQGLPPGRWRERFLFALKASLAVLAPHRDALVALLPVLIGDSEEGLFSLATVRSRQRVQGAFETAVLNASDAPAAGGDAEGLGRVLYVMHLAVILWWLIDKSPSQRATGALISMLERALPAVALGLRFPPARTSLRLVDTLCREALFGELVGP